MKMFRNSYDNLYDTAYYEEPNVQYDECPKFNLGVLVGRDWEFKGNLA